MYTACFWAAGSPRWARGRVWAPTPQRLWAPWAAEDVGGGGTLAAHVFNGKKLAKKLTRIGIFRLSPPWPRRIKAQQPVDYDSFPRVPASLVYLATYVFYGKKLAKKLTKNQHFSTFAARIGRDPGQSRPDSPWIMRRFPTSTHLFLISVGSGPPLRPGQGKAIHLARPAADVSCLRAPRASVSDRRCCTCCRYCAYCRYCGYCGYGSRGPPPPPGGDSGEGNHFQTFSEHWNPIWGTTL